jgi:hypothetical protein
MDNTLISVVIIFILKSLLLQFPTNSSSHAMEIALNSQDKKNNNTILRCSFALN